MATQQMAIAEPQEPTRETARTEGELSISLSEMLGLLAVCEEPEDSETGERFSADVQRNVQQAVVDKLRRYQRFFSFCDATSDECDSEIKRLQARKQATDGAKARLRRYLARAMDMHRIQRLDAGTVVFTLNPGASSLNVTNPEKIPFEYKEETIVVTIDNAAVKRALKAGEPIEGAELKVGDPFIVAR